MTNAEARFNNSLRPRKPEGSLGRTAQDGHLDSHTAPELCNSGGMRRSDITVMVDRALETLFHVVFSLRGVSQQCVQSRITQQV